jgi:hypothetical protein
MNRAENRASALGENFQRLFVASGAAAPIDLNQTVLPSRVSARDTTTTAPIPDVGYG